MKNPVKKLPSLPPIGSVGMLVVVLFIIWIIASGNWKKYWDFLG